MYFFIVLYKNNNKIIFKKMFKNLNNQVKDLSQYKV
jgi:REP element-mobilizing transposase RayT